jgi:hypothetical protein
VVIVPTYKKEISELEKISLRQMKSVLGCYDIYFVCPMSLDSQYLFEFKIERFDDKYFSDIEGYNHLMLSEIFYLKFIQYEYMLIYQLDAFVFEDRLLEFCNYGFDYIGAPWITGYGIREENDYKYVHVGNGGFSLRKVGSCLSFVKKYDEEIKEYKFNEDLFFATRSGLDFKIAPVEVALQFAFETEVRECYKLNNNHLPFGCHAWAKHDWKFWKPIFNELGYKVELGQEFGNLDMENTEKYEQQKRIEAFWSYNVKICLDANLNKKILIWGTGIYGKRMFKILLQDGWKIEGFIDNNLNNQGNELDDYEIFAPSIIADNGMCFVIIAISGENGMKVKEQLIDMGKIYYVDFALFSDIIGT